MGLQALQQQLQFRVVISTVDGQTGLRLCFERHIRNAQQMKLQRRTLLGC